MPESAKDIVRDRLYYWMICDLKRSAHLNKDCSGYFDDPKDQDETIQSRKNKLQQVIPDYDGGALIGSFILGLQAIQVLAKLFSEKQENNEEGKRYKDFVDNFLPQYKEHDLYWLRCSLAKEYSANFIRKDKDDKGFSLSSKNPKKHLIIIDNKININLENFIRDIENAFNLFFDSKPENLEINKRLENYQKDKMMSAVGALSSVDNKF